MTKVSIADMHKPVEWIDYPSTIDPSFLDEVPLIPDKALIAILEPLMQSELDLLFGLDFPAAWALFDALPGYKSRLKKLFRRKVLDSLDPELAIETLDNLDENGVPTGTIEGEKLYAMLCELTSLNQLLEQIYCTVFSTLKP